MFGYIKPYNLELKLKSIYRYKNLYCGLCHQLGKNFGQIYRCALSYDVTFLLTVLNALDTESDHISVRCPANPFKKIELDVSQRALDYSAFINYYMVYLKVEDDINDDNSVIKKFLKKIIKSNKKYKQQLNRYNSIAEDLKLKMQQFNQKENSIKDFDRLTNSFGDFFAAIFSDYLCEIGYEITDELQSLTFDLGKWIYIIDAYDDYLKDKRKNEFNLLDTVYFPDGQPSLDIIHKKIQRITTILIMKMQENFNEIVFLRDSDIIENVVVLGSEYQYSRVVKKRYKSKLCNCENSSSGKCCKKCGSNNESCDTETK